MKVLVPLKRVPDPYAKVRVLPDGSGLDLATIKFEINPFDEIALEAALQLKDQGHISEIILVTIGPAAAEDQLRKGLAMGADRAILIEHPIPNDSFVVASEFAKVVEQEAIEMVIMGKQGTDTDKNQTGQMLAALLDWPQATFASKIEINANHADVTRETDEGEEMIRVPFPCVITADLRLASPRYVALPGIIKARSKPLQRRQPQVDLAGQIKVLSIEPAPQRPPGHKVANVDALFMELQAKGLTR